MCFCIFNLFMGLHWYHCQNKHIGDKEVSSLQLLVIGRARDGYDGVGIGSLHGDGIILYLDCDNDCTNLASGDSKLVILTEPLSTSWFWQCTIIIKGEMIQGS